MIEVINQTRINSERLGLKQIKQLSARLNHIFGLDSADSLEIIFTTPRQIQAINQEYRHKHQPTDVLSFPQHYQTNFPQSIIGTIILCPAVIKQQEGTYNLIPYLIHGYLHLMGYDHESKQDQPEWDKITRQVEHLMAIKS